MRTRTDSAQGGSPVQSTMLTALKLYDNYTRSLRGFEALKAGAVGLYTCGPTVYDYQHIGNFRTFLFQDLLRRALEWNGTALTHPIHPTTIRHPPPPPPPHQHNIHTHA